MHRRIALGGVLLLTVCIWSFAQQPKVVSVPARQTPASSGREMFADYCASCHGGDGKGGGPAAAALKVPATDLTQLARQNGGKFPARRVAKAISGEAGIPAHGSKEMPVWGPVFLSMSQQHESVARLRIANLTDYIQSLQQK
jgi:mono/diheme cytochrome c family protein